MDTGNFSSPIPKPRTRFNVGSEAPSLDANLEEKTIQERITEIVRDEWTPENISVSPCFLTCSSPVSGDTVLSERDFIPETTAVNGVSTNISFLTKCPSIFSPKSVIENDLLAIFANSNTTSTSSNPSIRLQKSNSATDLDRFFFPEENNIGYKYLTKKVHSSYMTLQPSIKFIENPLYMSLFTFRALSLSKLEEEDGNETSNFTSVYTDKEPSGNLADILKFKSSASKKSYFSSDSNYNSTSVGRDFLCTDNGPLCSEVLSAQGSNFVNELVSDHISGTAVAFFGFVMIHLGKKDRKRVHAKLRNMELSFYENDETDDILYGPYYLIDCKLICREANKISIRVNIKESQRLVVFTADDSADTWSLLLGECWLSQFDLLRNNVHNNTICGTFWLRQGTNSEWMFTAAVFYERTVYYVVPTNPNCVYELDIRKVLTLREKLKRFEWCPYCKQKNQRGPFMLSLEGCSLYVECTDDWSTSKWLSVLQTALTLPCKTLEEYKLTADNVPIVADKCMRFIAAFGIQLEGIYRRNGKISETRDILTRLLDDPCGTHLIASTDETVYAVADVLRQFFRRLGSPLFPPNLHQQLFTLVNSENTYDDMAHYMSYRQILQLMPTVHYYTLRKLMSHLKGVVTYSHINKASADNLAKVFAPSLFHTDNEENSNVCFRDNSIQMNVIIDLLVGFDVIFQITIKEEISRAMVEQAQFKRTNAIAARANGLLIPIHMWERENRPFNVKTDLAAEEVCRETVARRGFDAPLDGHFAIFEVIRGGTLSRRLAPSEKLSCIVINRWLSWQCTDAFLLFDHDSSPYQENGMNSFCDKVKIAEPGSRTFRSYELIVEDGTKIAAYKNGKLWKLWDVNTTIFYMGAEPSRKAPNPHSLTFFHTSLVLTMKVKLVGFCISFKSSQERYSFANLIEYIQTGGHPTPLVHL